MLGCWEILVYDVLDLLPTDAQQAELEELLDGAADERGKFLKDSETGRPVFAAL